MAGPARRGGITAAAPESAARPAALAHAVVSRYILTASRRDITYVVIACVLTHGLAATMKGARDGAVDHRHAYQPDVRRRRGAADPPHLGFGCGPRGGG